MTYHTLITADGEIWRRKTAITTQSGWHVPVRGRCHCFHRRVFGRVGKHTFRETFTELDPKHLELQTRGAKRPL